MFQYKQNLERYKRTLMPGKRKLALTPSAAKEYYKRSLQRQLLVKAENILGRRVGNSFKPDPPSSGTRGEQEDPVKKKKLPKRRRLHRIKKMSRKCSRYRRV